MTVSVSDGDGQAKDETGWISVELTKAARTTATKIPKTGDVYSNQLHGTIDSKYNKPNLTPAEYFEKVAWEDLKQNKKLSMAMINGSGLYKLNRASSTKPMKARFFVCALALTMLAMSQMSRMVLYQTITQMVENSGEPTSSGSSISTDGSCPWPEEETKENDKLAVCTTSESVLEQQDPTTTTEMPVAEIETTADMFETAPMTDVAEQAKPSELSPTQDYSIEAQDEEQAQVLKLIDAAIQDQLNKDELENLAQSAGGESANATNQHIHKVVVFHKYPRYKWSIQQQNLLFGGFFYSYFFFMIIGGRLAEAYGAKYVLFVSVAGSAVINILTPWMADTSYILLFISRIVMGAIQAGVFPGMYALFAKWLTMTEASIFAPLIKMNLRLGMLLGSFFPGIISGWPNVYYLTSFLSAMCAIAWWVFATSDPADNPWVSEDELRLINRKKHCHQLETEANLQTNSYNGPVTSITTANGHESIELKDVCKKGANNGNINKLQMNMRESTSTKSSGANKPVKRATPWLKIITNPSVIGLIVAKLSFNYGLDFLAMELPSYLKYVHHASKQKISTITSGMFSIQVILIVFVGWLAKIAVQRRPLGLSKTGVRKLFQGVSSFGLGTIFLLLTFNNCNLLYVAILLQIGSLLSMFTSGGETMLPYDLSEEYPATIMAVANSIANLSAATTTTVAAIVLGEHAGSYDRWNLLMYLIAGINIFGGIVFTCLVKAEPIDFSDNSRGNKLKRDDLEACKKVEK